MCKQDVLNVYLICVISIRSFILVHWKEGCCIYKPGFYRDNLHTVDGWDEKMMGCRVGEQMEKSSDHCTIFQHALTIPCSLVQNDRFV